MEEYEEAYLEAVTDNLAASIASGMRGVAEESLSEDGETLTDGGRLWVQGYLTGRLATIRSGATGNPNLADADLEQVVGIVEENQENIAAQLYG